MRGGSILSPLIQLGYHAVRGLQRIPPRAAANFITGLLGTAGLAYGAKKLHDMSGNGLLNLPGQERLPAQYYAQRPLVPTMSAPPKTAAMAYDSSNVGTKRRAAAPTTPVVYNDFNLGMRRGTDISHDL